MGLFRTPAAAASLALPLLTACGTGFYAAPVHRTAYHDAFDADLRGWAVGATAPLDPTGRTTYFTEVSWAEDEVEELDTVELRSGVAERWWVGDSLAVGGTLDFAYEWAHVERFRNRNQLYSIGVGALVEVPLGPHVLVFARTGWRYAVDRTARATCVDGSTSQADGPDVCVGGGGVDFFNDQLGDGWIFEAMAGVRFRIGR